MFANSELDKEKFQRVLLGNHVGINVKTKKDDKLKCYTLKAKDGHTYVTCDDKNKKKKKIRRKRLVIIPDKPVNKSVPFQPDFEGGLQDLNQLLFRQGEYELLNINRRGHTFL
tara:strand:- start:112 stop:450 length:339 start_codon:yes stop_codon:yes gene_type:complete